MTAKSADLGVWPKRLGWLVLIWTVSVFSLGVLAYALRLFMHAAGLAAQA